MANFNAYDDFNGSDNAFEDASFDFSSFIDSTQSQDPFFEDQSILSPLDLYIHPNPQQQQQQQNFMSSILSADGSSVNHSQFDNQLPSTCTSSNTGSLPFPSQTGTLDQSAGPLSQSSPANQTRSPRNNAETNTEPKIKPEPKKRGRKRKVHNSKMEADESRQRFLERNRIAASKCREKKKAWMDRLEAMRFDLESEKLQNMQMVLVLRQELRGLINVAREHVEAGCALHGLKQYVEEGEARLVGVEGKLESQFRVVERKMMGDRTPDSDRDSAIELLSPTMGVNASKIEA